MPPTPVAGVRYIRRRIAVTRRVGISLTSPVHSSGQRRSRPEKTHSQP